MSQMKPLMWMMLYIYLIFLSILVMALMSYMNDYLFKKLECKENFKKFKTFINWK